MTFQTDIATTAEIAARRRLGLGDHLRWTEWAQNMLAVGHDMPGLCMMAGEIQPFNAFEMDDLFDRSMFELGLPSVQTDAEACQIFCASRTRAVLNHKTSWSLVLSELFSIEHVHFEHGGQYTISGLYWTWRDLEETGCTYHTDIRPETLDDIVLGEFQHWYQVCSKTKIYRDLMLLP
ncbi:hypothetical protein [Coralliovum pocilloporae]|uniref:hypothetical protein n=1 Tax=Coralliovum pocilloporae TaxID=3066369 RepID=UPI003306A86F